METKVILTLGNADDIHLKRWIYYFQHSDDFRLIIASFEKGNKTDVHLHSNKLISYFQLFKYCLINKVDMIHAHYAGFYGLLGALLPGKLKVLSVWGSDIYMPSSSSKIRVMVVRVMLSIYKYVISTSKDMADSANRIYHREYIVMPFGVDTSVYKPDRSINRSNKIVLGTVKKLHNVYGVDRLIVLFSEFCKKNSNIEAELHIYGDGEERNYLEDLAYKLNVRHSTFFFGRAEQCDVPSILNSFDIFLALSRSESFGVSVIEASAVGLPVITSDVGGLKEVVRDQMTGYVMNMAQCPTNEQVDKLSLLAINKKLRASMGNAGRQFVKEKYEYELCASRMSDFYQNILK